MNDEFRQPPACSNGGAPSAADALYGARCGARLVPVTLSPRSRFSFLWLLLGLPPIAVLAMGSCGAMLAIGAGAVMLNWKVVAAGAGALLLL